MKSIYFVRHGETVWNVENKICGSTDIELTESCLLYTSLSETSEEDKERIAENMKIFNEYFLGCLLYTSRCV